MVVSSFVLSFLYCFCLLNFSMIVSSFVFSRFLSLKFTYHSFLSLVSFTQFFCHTRTSLNSLTYSFYSFFLSLSLFLTYFVSLWLFVLSSIQSLDYNRVGYSVASTLTLNKQRCYTFNFSYYLKL